MNSPVSELRIDPEFESKIPPLTDDEYRQLEENILSEEIVLTPLIVWKGTIVDGHNRYKIVQKNPDIPFTVHEKEFENRYEALAWICRNQLGRRNLTPIQKKMLIGDRYEAEKMAHGATKGHKDSLRTETIQGVAGFVDLYHDEYDPKRLVNRCRKFDPMRIHRSAKNAGDALPVPQRYIFEVWKMYNGSSKSHALPLKF